MAAFNYSALDESGREIQGVLEADTSRQARSQLREQRLFPLEVTPVARAGAERLRLGSRGMSSGSLSLLTRQWSMLLGAGLTIEQSLTALIEQTEDAKARQILAGVRAEVLSGHSLHSALGQYEHAFPPIYRAVVNAGEKSGELDTLLARLAEYLENWQTTRQKIVQALLYPALMTVAAIVITIGLVTYVVPQIVGVFKQGKQSLPLLTQALILLSAFLRAAWYWLVLGGGAAFYFIRRALRRDEALRLRWHRQLLRLPLVGRHLRTLESARFASTLAIMIGSGVPLLTALETGKAVINNRVLRQAVDHAIRQVREGTPLHRALAAEKLFPPLLVHLIASGEASGTLDKMLERAAAQQQAELDRRTAIALGLFEPVLILVMGGGVLLIVLAILMPIIEINLMMR
jgi:general secretion pathway protein F